MGLEWSSAAGCDEMNPRQNEIAFERATRDYYFARTGRDWSGLSPMGRQGWRATLGREARRTDEWIARQVAESEKAISNERDGR